MVFLAKGQRINIFSPVHLRFSVPSAMDESSRRGPINELAQLFGIGVLLKHDLEKQASLTWFRQPHRAAPHYSCVNLLGLP